MSEYASNGKANAGLALGIIGTALGAINWSGVAGSSLGVNSTAAQAEQSEIASLESQVAELKAMRYSDQTGIDLYKNIIAQSNAADTKINSNMKEVMQYIVQLGQEVALNKQAVEYENKILDNKIESYNEKLGLITNYNQQLNGLADASIISYVNSTFLPGTLKLAATSICPSVVTK